MQRVWPQLRLMGTMSVSLNLLVQMQHCRKSVQFGACILNRRSCTRYTVVGEAGELVGGRVEGKEAGSVKGMSSDHGQKIGKV